MLALRLLLRNWRSGEILILSAALLLAVSVVTAVSVFTQRLELSLERQSSHFLAADRIVKSRLAMPQTWAELAAAKPLRQATTAAFSSMVFAGEHMHLASVKAVSQHYPLRGQLEISDTPFAAAEQVYKTQALPAPGEAWVDSRLLALLHLSLGQNLMVGELALKVSKILIREPDQSSGFSLLGPRVLINQQDLAATEVIQPGSRIEYRWLLAGEPKDIEQFEKEIRPLLGEHYQLQGVKQAQRNISSALARGGNFLMLAGMMAVLLAGVAIAIAAQQFAHRQVNQVALIKSLGASASRVRQLYVGQLLLMAVAATVLGLLVGEILQQLIAQALKGIFNVALMPANFSAYTMGMLTGIVCVLCFALPPLWHLPTVSPLKVLRSELSVSAVSLWLRGLFGVAALAGLIYIYSNNAWLSLAVIAGIAVLVVTTGLLALLLLRSGHQLGARAGSVWRLAIANIERYKAQAITQIMVLACAFMLLMVLTVLRLSLIDEWRMQLPEHAPNHFILNISQGQRPELAQWLKAQNLETANFYPMVLGRVTALKAQAVTESQRELSGALRRELNLTWAENLAADNKIVQGQWWPQWQSEKGLVGVSVEQELAQELGLEIGSTISFSLGGLLLDAEVASIRSLQWESMQPNFYFIFSPGALAQFSPSYMTSVYMAGSQKILLNQLLRNHPTVVVIEADRIIENLQNIIQQVSRAIELVLALVLVAGFLVLAAAVNASKDVRMQEAALLRALGSNRRLILGSLSIEFALLGLLAGVLAVFAGELVLAALSVWVFEQAVNWHVAFWFIVPALGLIIIASFGVFACRKVVLVPPAIVLRDVAM